MEATTLLNLGIFGVFILTVVLFFFTRRHPKVALSETYRSFPIIQKQNISSNTRRIRVALQSAKTKLGLPVGCCVMLTATIDGKVVTKPYTPISSDDDLGYCDFVIKIYPNGKMTQHLESLKVGDSISMRGPSGSIQYIGKTMFKLGRTLPAKSFRQIGLIGGGSGITPLFQVMLAVSKEEVAVAPQVSLIFGNMTEEDILLRDELDAFAKRPNIRVHYTLDKPPANWAFGSGFVTADMIRANMPAPADDTLMLLCGPEPMVRFVEGHLINLGYKNIRFF